MENDQDDADRCDVEQGDRGAAPEPGRGGRERLACCGDAGEGVLRAAPGVRAAPGRFEPASIRPSRPAPRGRRCRSAWCSWAA